MKYISYLLGGGAAAAAAIYLFVYLHRWEWQRALTSGVLLLIVEVFLVATVLLSRLGRLERRLVEAEARAEEVQRRLQQSREAAPERFRWLDTRPFEGREDRNDTFVFVPVLMAAGALLSVVAFVIQKIASTTGRARAERMLAGRLTSLAAPPGGTRGDVPGIEERPAVPPGRPGRVLFKATVGVVVTGLLGALTFAIADAVQTRPAPTPDSAASAVVFRVTLRNADTGPMRDGAARDLWETCRRSTAASREYTPLSSLGDGVYAGVVRPALPSHDMMRLRGCLRDTTANRARADVLGEGQVPPLP
ncbi:hypothetical protein FE633_25645 [Streptomyces montanus]|uniref:Uncharacterized protein n=1 Tax=Streptomyces montanus TaxID=2580423 RepID=A0A5R9FV31_9ACTN|nr:hypothetical protein [Streptomyces montanus]TLS43345.1 hypothetical protein FE633_25645 [Streptomyces montanus]